MKVIDNRNKNTALTLADVLSLQFYIASNGELYRKMTKVREGVCDVTHMISGNTISRCGNEIIKETVDIDIIIK